MLCLPFPFPVKIHKLVQRTGPARLDFALPDLENGEPHVGQRSEVSFVAPLVGVDFLLPVFGPCFREPEGRAVSVTVPEAPPHLQRQFVSLYGDVRPAGKASGVAPVPNAVPGQMRPRQPLRRGVFRLDSGHDPGPLFPGHYIHGLSKAPACCAAKFRVSIGCFHRGNQQIPDDGTGIASANAGTRLGRLPTEIFSCVAGFSRYIWAFGSGRSSGVEHNLAKVRVVSSNLIARSIFPKALHTTMALP